MRMPKVLVVPATGLIRFSMEWRRIALHLGDKSWGLDSSCASSVCSSYHVPMVVAVKIKSAHAKLQ
jgi:hypothetical protein